MKEGKIAVIGSVVLDIVTTEEGETYCSFGGITYSIVALARLMPGLVIYPVTYLGKQDISEFRGTLDPLKNVRFDFVQSWRGTNINRINYSKSGPRSEEFLKVTPPITYNMISPLLDSDAVLVNFIKNDDFSHENLKSLSFSYEGLLYVDIHSLLRDVSKRGKFILHHPKNWVSWVSLPDIIQMNRSEAHALTGLRSRNLKELKLIANIVLSQGPRIVTVTLGRNGSITLWKENSEINSKRSFSIKTTRVDPTGAGDTYGAAFLSAILRGMDPGSASDYANLKAAEAITGTGITPLFSLTP